jgi:hypothetical protein
VSPLDALARSGAEAPALTHGVYVLAHLGEVVYVGLSKTNVWARVGEHTRTFEFDRVFVFAVPLSELAAYEGAIARRFNPRYMTSAGKDCGRDEEILSKLGLTQDLEAAAAFDERHSDRHRGTRTERRANRINLAGIAS